MFEIKRSFLLSFLSFSVLGVAAQAQDITVTGQLSTFPVLVQAQSAGCDGESPVSFGYSVDNQRKLTLGSASSIDTTDANIAVGTHLLHFKTWTKKGICPVVTLAINVNNAASGSGTGTGTGSGSGSGVGSGTSGNPSYAFPVNAVAAAGLTASSHWEWTHDSGTPGSSVGSSTYPVSNPSMDNEAREFHVSYSAKAGEIYHLTVGSDEAATHFVYDAYVYVVDPSQVANVEMDMNHVTAGGRTVILGTQCSSYSGTWEYVYTSGGGPHWHPSNIKCDPRTWAANTWHHVQIATHHDGNGVATYDWVNVDGTYTNFQNATAQASLALGWSKGDIIINFQLDGTSKNSGEMVAYMDKLQVVRW